MQLWTQRLSNHTWTHVGERVTCGTCALLVQDGRVSYVMVTNFDISYLRTSCRNVSLSVNRHYAPHTAQMFSVCFAVKGHSCQHAKGQLSSNKRVRAITKATESIAKLRQSRRRSLALGIISSPLLFLLSRATACLFIQHISAQGALLCVSVRF